MSDLVWDIHPLEKRFWSVYLVTLPLGTAAVLGMSDTDPRNYRLLGLALFLFFAAAFAGGVFLLFKRMQYSLRTCYRAAAAVVTLVCMGAF